MSLEKSIASGKDRRAPYHGVKSVDASCRPGGECPYCVGNRTVQRRRELDRARESQRDYDNGD
jgi:hypothetical protein